MNEYTSEQIEAMDFFYATCSPTQAEIESQQSEYFAYLEREGMLFKEKPLSLHDRYLQFRERQMQLPLVDPESIIGGMFKIKDLLDEAAFKYRAVA